ncbi:MAG: TetR/AcrR family transcriptional regulator [Thermodesulfovibrionales bacterium]
MKKELTRQKILEAGLKLFSEKGFIGATTKEIAKEAGIAEITLFRHFPTKENLFEEVISRYSFLPALKNLLPEIKQLPYEDALSAIARKFLDNLFLRKDMIRIMQSEIHRYPEQMQKVYNSLIDEVIRTLASYFEEMQEKGMLSEFDADMGARAFFGMFFSYFNAQEFKMRKKFKGDDREKTIREFIRIFSEGTKR